MIPLAIKDKLVLHCEVRIRIQGVIGPEYIDGSFIDIYQDGIHYQEPGGWREVLWAHHSQITEIGRQRIN